MNFIQIDYENGGMLDGHFGYQIRTAYLLADVTNIVGHSTFLITFDYIVSKLTVVQMCKLVHATPQNEVELLTVIDAYLDRLKALKAMKHPPTVLYQNFKKFENSLKTTLQSWMGGVSLQAKNAGFEGIFEMFDINKFTFYNPEIENSAPNKNSLNIFSALSNKAPTNAIDVSIWLLPFMFYTTNNFDFDIITDISLLEEGKPYLIKSITLSNYLLVTPTELTSIKLQLQNEIIPFKTAMNQWAKACRSEENSSEIFKTKVVPTFPDTQATIDNNEIIKHQKKVETNKLEIDLMIGEVSPISFWKFYKQHELLSETQYNTLEEEYNSQKPYTLPVIMFQPSNSEINRLNLKETQNKIENIIHEDIVATRKSISVD